MLRRTARPTAWPTPAGGFPWAIWLVNTTGAFVLGLVLVHLFFASDVIFGHEIPLRSVGCSLVCVTG